MGWLADLFSVTRPNTEAFKAITAELRALKDEYKRENARLKQRTSDLEKEVEKLKEWEADCHKKIVPLLEENRNLLDQLLFYKRLKPDNPET